MLTAFLILLLVGAGIVWVVLKFNVEIKHSKLTDDILISYSRAKVGDVLKPLKQPKEEIII